VTGSGAIRGLGDGGPARRAAGTVAGLACALALICAATATAGPTTPLGHDGRWITDADGRVVILHGVNMVYKRPPYYPAATGFGEDDAAFLETQGFNTVRLGLIYKAVEPGPGSYDDAYLDEIAATERVLADHGIFSQLDFHQDLYNERYGGEGWPDWATIDDGLPAEPLSGFPGSYVSSPGLNQAFNNFWNNGIGPGGVGLQNRYAAAFRHVAERFAERRTTIGFDLLNEPWPGSPWPSCASPEGCPVFDAQTMVPFYAGVIAAIREVEPQKLIWYEPNVGFNFGADSHIAGLGDTGLGFSFHVYCLAGALGAGDPGACPTFEEVVFANADKQASETGDALLLSEFGATDDLEVIRRNVESAESHMVSWQYWHYCGCDDPTTSGPGVQAIVVDPAQPPSGANIKEAKLDVLVRPYPQVVAGTPERFDFVESSRRFELAYVVTGPGGHDFGTAAKGWAVPVVPADAPQSEVFVPARPYPDGYEVDVDGGGIASAPNASLLRIAACPGATRVSLTVKPAGEGVVDGPDCVVAGAPRPKLKLKVRPRRPDVGEHTCFRAVVKTKLGGTRVAGAKVRFGKRSKRTNRKGKVRICRTLRSPGPSKLVATKLGFRRDIASVRAR
jgi:endoglycosylceramidase